MTDFAVEPSVRSICEWVRTMVESAGFEDWKASHITRTPTIVRQSQNRVCLFARLDTDPEASERHPFYYKSEVGLVFFGKLGEIGTYWEIPVFVPGSLEYQIAHTKISYKGIVWHFDFKY